MATGNPYIEGGLALADIGLGVIGMILQGQAMEAAKLETKALDYRNFQYQVGRDKETDKMNREQLKLNKQAGALNQKQFDFNSMLSKYGVTQDNVTRVGQLLNNNPALKKRTLQTWGN